MKKASPTFSLKDQLFNREKVEWLAGRLAAAHPEFQRDDFCKEVLKSFPELELKERIYHITECLAARLPQDYTRALRVILKALPPALDPKGNDDDFGDFIIAPLGHFVATRGCSARHLEKSLRTLKEITMRFTAEDAIRYFINEFPEVTMAFLTSCASDDNYHVRRLASEGTRPKLPWCQKIGIHHEEAIPILNQLYADETRYVTRSIANHLNDISKLEPGLVLETLKRWKKSGKQGNKEMAFIIRHATRTLVKQGHPEALALMGFGAKPEIGIRACELLTPEVKIGDALEFCLEIEANRDQGLLIDYRMQFAGDGKPGGQKVFKLKQAQAGAGTVLKIRKKHPMRLMTTRTLYPGEHHITLQVNGVDFNSFSFNLVG